MMVIFGTVLLATTCTILAPSLMMPSRSARVPTMKPVTSCKNKRGMPFWFMSSTKRAPLSAASA
ncbi:hypothetical protein HRbin09_00872 [bacterium HR09]|nr:hypothetical protein HRbin09_00872 [bacterium HR09]